MLNRSKSSFSREDQIGFAILMILYTIQGIAQGYFGRTINVLFIEKGAHSSDLGTLSFALMPYSFKFLIAPFMDTYYNKKMGKRKTYIIPMQYLFSIICFILSFSLSDEIKERKTKSVLFFGVLTNIIMAVQDVAVDGWALSIMSRENLAYGALSQTIGLTLGIILAFNVFIPLNSIDFCNQYIFSSPQQSPFITNENFWIWTGIVSFCLTLLIHIFIKENQNENEEITSMVEIIKTLKFFVINPNLRQLVLITITSGLTLAPITAIADTILLQRGFPKETITNITTALIPVQIITSIVVSKLCKQRFEMKLRLWAYIISYLNCAFLFWVVNRFYKETNYQETLYYTTIAFVVMTITFYANFLAHGSYSNRICDQSIGGTFLTTLAAISNFGQLSSITISLYINEYVSWEKMSILALVTTPIYFIWYQKQLKELSNKSAEHFSMKNMKRE